MEEEHSIQRNSIAVATLAVMVDTAVSGVPTNIVFQGALAGVIRFAVDRVDVEAVAAVLEDAARQLRDHAHDA